MDVLYTVETFDTLTLDDVREMSLLWAGHWQEAGVDPKRYAFKPSVRTYLRLLRDEKLHLVLARCEERIVGYFVGLIAHHLHAGSTLACHADHFYLEPTARRGLEGLRLVRFAEQSLRDRGVKVVMAGVPKRGEVWRLMKWMGWDEHEVVYAKHLGD